MSPREAVFLLYLLIQSLNDIREREIHLPIAAITALTGFVFLLVLKDRTALSVGAALIPGLLYLAFSILTRGRIGTGDAIVVMTAALYLSPDQILPAVLWSLLLSSGFSVYLLFHKKKGLSSCFPYLPFLLIGLLLTMLPAAL